MSVSEGFLILVVHDFLFSVDADANVCALVHQGALEFGLEKDGKDERGKTHVGADEVDEDRVIHGLLVPLVSGLHANLDLHFFLAQRRPHDVLQEHDGSALDEAEHGDPGEADGLIHGIGALAEDLLGCRHRAERDSTKNAHADKNTRCIIGQPAGFKVKVMNMSYVSVRNMKGAST